MDPEILKRRIENCIELLERDYASRDMIAVCEDAEVIVKLSYLCQVIDGLDMTGRMGTAIKLIN